MRNSRIFGIITAANLVSVGCTQSDMRSLSQSLNRSLNGPQSAAAANQYEALEPGLQPFNQGSQVTKAQIQALVRYDFKGSGQSTEAIHKLLGGPERISESQEFYPISETSDGLHTPRYLVVLYEPHPSCNWQCSKAYDYYTP